MRKRSNFRRTLRILFAHQAEGVPVMPLPFFIAGLFGKAAAGAVKAAAHHHAKATLASKLAAKVIDKAQDKAIDAATDRVKAKLQSRKDKATDRA